MFWRRPIVVGAIGVLVTILLVLIVVLVLLRTGDAEAVSDNAALIGALAGLGGVFTTQMVTSALEDQRRREARRIEAERVEETRRIEEGRVQADALQQYFGQIGELVEKDLRNSPEDDEKRVLARTRTLMVLRGLHPRRKWLLLDFLYESKLSLRFKYIDSRSGR